MIRKIRNMSLKWQYMIPVSLVIIVGILSTYFFMIYKFSTTSKNITNLYAAEYTAHFTNALNSYMQNRIGAIAVLSKVASNWQLARFDREKAMHQMAGILSNNQFLDNIWMVWEPNSFDHSDSSYRGALGSDENGQFVPYLRKQQDRILYDRITSGYNEASKDGAMQWYEETKKREKIFVSDPYNYTHTNGETDLLITVAIPIMINEKLAGILGTDLMLKDDFFQRNHSFSDQMSFSKTGYLFGISPLGNVFQHTTNTDLIGKNVREILSTEGQNNVQQSLTDGELSLFTDQDPNDQKEYLNLIRSLKFHDEGRYWAVGYRVPLKNIPQTLNTTLGLITLFGVAIVLLVSITLYFLAKKNLEPLQRIKEFSLKVASGDLSSLNDIKKDFPFFTKNEIEQLESSFHSMAKTVHKKAFYDSLTGLPNRALFYENLAQTIRSANRYDYKFAVLFIDMDGFKQINDTKGHAAGDVVLIETGKRLQQSVRDSDIVARLGGDEFVALIERIEDPTDATKIAKSIMARLSLPIALPDDTHITINGSIGIALFPYDGDTIDAIMAKADSAMYASKENGKGRYTFYADLPKEEIQ